MSIRKLLVATDFSPLAEKAYAVAARLSRRFAVPLHLAHVLETFPSAAGEFEDSVAEDFANALRETAESGADFEGLTIVPHLLRGPIAARALAELIEREGIDLLVVSTHGYTSFQRFVLGSFAERMLRTSPAPVLVYRERRRDGELVLEPRRVLVPLDFSPRSLAVLPAVRFLSTHYGCRFVFLFVKEPLPHPSFSERLRRWMAGASARAEESFAALRDEELPAVDGRFEVREGVPYREISDVAAGTDSDLIVIGTQGLLGSVAQNVTRDAPCPVVSVPHRDRT